MLNECLFMAHVLCLLGAVGLAHRLGSAALTSSMLLFSLLANVLVLKQVLLFSQIVTCTDAYTIASMVCLNVLREHFGSRAAKIALLSELGLMLLVCLLFTLHMAYLPSANDSMHQVYQQWLPAVTTLTLQSLLISALVQWLDYGLFDWLKTYRSTSSFVKRMLLSLFFSQFLDTLLFTFALAQAVDLQSFVSVFFWSYLIKCLTIICMGTLSSWLCEYANKLPSFLPSAVQPAQS